MQFISSSRTHIPIMAARIYHLVVSYVLVCQYDYTNTDVCVCVQSVATVCVLFGTNVNMYNMLRLLIRTSM